VPDVAGKRVLLLGTGREIVSFARAVVEVAAAVVAVDGRDGDSARAWREEWGERIPLVIAERTEGFAGEVDVAVSSPGIPPHSPLRADLLALGIPVTMPTDLWLRANAERTTAVTGSKGKSTTTSLIHALLRAHGVDASLGGNIGIGVWSLPQAERFAVELSSQQASTVSRSPDVAVLTALFPEHLDWHGGLDEYYADKLNLVAHGARRVVVNGSDPVLVRELAVRHPEIAADSVGAPGDRWRVEGGAVLRDGAVVVPPGASPLRGDHNLLNLALALAAVEASGVAVDPAAVAVALADFAPLEHRLEEIPEGALTFVDDSLSTAPQAVVRALDAYAGRPVVLLLGGHDRGVDYSPLAERLAADPPVALVGLPGSGADVLARVAPAGIPAETAEDMTDAVRRARAHLPEGGVVLLSPAAPSYGIYADYRERAADFRRAVAATAADKLDG